MKNKKLYIFTILFLMIIGVNKTSAYVFYENNDLIVNEEYILNSFNSYNGFDFNSYNYISCKPSTTSITCYAYNPSSFLGTSILSSSSNTFIYYSSSSAVFCYKFDFWKSYLESNVSTESISTIPFINNGAGVFTNFLLPNIGDNVYVTYANTNWSGINSLNFNFSSNDEPVEEEYEIENRIYLPFELEEEQCPYILDKDTIRVYDEEPTQNSTITYTDYFINSHYISKSGSETFENDVLMCLDKSKFTTAFYYRFDFHEIMIIFISILTIVYAIFGKIIHSFFLGFRR